MRLGSLASAFTNSSSEGGDSFQPFSFAIAWRVLRRFATPPAAPTSVATSSFVSGVLP